MVYNRQTRKPVAKVPLNEDEFSTLMTFKSRPNSFCHTTADFIATACRAYLAKARKPKGPKVPDELSLPSGPVNPLCLCLYDRKHREVISRVQLSEAEFNCLVATSTESAGVAAVVAYALRSFYNNFKPVVPPAAPAATVPVSASDSPLALVLFDNREGRSIEQIPVSLSQYQIIRQRTDGTSSTVADSLTNALRRITRNIPTEKLEIAQLEMSGLLELFVTKFTDIARGETSFDGPACDAMAAGFCILADSAEAHLKTAIEEVHQALYAPDAPPAPVAVAA